MEVQEEAVLILNMGQHYYAFTRHPPPELTIICNT